MLPIYIHVAQDLIHGYMLLVQYPTCAFRDIPLKPDVPHVQHSLTSSGTLHHHQEETLLKETAVRWGAADTPSSAPRSTLVDAAIWA